MARTSTMIDIEVFDERLQRTEDIDLWLKLARCGTFAYMDEVLATYDTSCHDGPRRSL